MIAALPIESLALAAPDLLAASRPLRATAAALRSTATQACQIWLDHTTGALGWTVAPAGQEPVLTAFSKPYDTWAGMSQVLPAEAWPADFRPASAHYFCGPMPQSGIPPRADTGFPARAAARAHDDAIVLLGDRIQALWPAAAGGFPWQWLVDPAGAEGPARFGRQYWRANVDPSGRYVLSVPGSSAWRLPTDGTGLANLYLAGDWLRTGLDCGCVEAAVMGGMQAARAICGYPAVILGDSDGV